ncbi:four-carbon acid sugar kinase family protein [Microlunatus soli]|nr:four-carbon acid sugar kinase family protein [Microlunatus soli]
MSNQGRPRFAFYGDDFTGSVDALLQFRRAGLSGLLLTSPDALAAATSERCGAVPDVIGLAGLARSLPTAELPDEVRPALRVLRDTGAAVVQYKACSTGDSSPTVGSLGRVLEIAREEFGELPIPVALAQPDFGRYTFFGHHFAADGDQVFRLDRQPTMRDHPITPATESDLRLQLAAQTRLPIGALPWTSYGDAGTVAATLRGDLPDGSDRGRPAAVIVDAFVDDHLDQVATAVLDGAAIDRSGQARFVLGSGGISGALGRAYRPADPLPELPTDCPPARRPMLVLSGSTSRRTREQIARSKWTVVDLFDPGVAERTATELTAGRDVIVSSTTDTDLSSAAADAVTDSDIPGALATVGERVLRSGDLAPDRMIICGGDTAGNVLRRLGVDAISILAQPWGNAVLCRATSRHQHLDGLELVLKGGQMGHPDLFTDVRSGNPQN